MVSSWTRDGCDVKLDVIPTLKAVLARKRKAEPSWTPSTLKFFDQAVRSARDTRAALGPAKPPTNGTGEMILHGDWRDFRYLDSLSIANRVECMTAWGLMNAGKVEVLARADKEGLGVQWRKAQH
jgi:hypothetical protein